MLPASIKKKGIIPWLVIAVCCMGWIPLVAQAGIYIDTKVISGTISAVKNYAVELDGTGTFYYPASEKMVVNLKPGDNITLRYFIDNSRGEPVRVYVEFAPGKYSLSESAPPKALRTRK